MKKLIIFLLLLLFLPELANALTYLDGSATGCVNGSTTYNPATRSCGGGTDKVYLDVGTFGTNIVASATNYMRAGSYFRNTGNTNYGALLITKAGSSDSTRTIVKAYPGEEQQVILGTTTRGATYNSNPSDATGAGSWLYYPNPAVSIYGAGNVTVSGVKTYGSFYVVGNVSNITVSDNDIGGGGDGSASSQGNALRINGGTAAPGISNVLIQNNSIHHNCRRQEDDNGSALIWYSFSGNVTGNTFYDTYGNDIENKDNRFQTGKNVTISYNLFLHSTLGTGAGNYDTGIRGLNQQAFADNTYVNNNIFVRKVYGVNLASIMDEVAPITPHYYFNNTFIDCDRALYDGSSSATTTVQFYNNLFYTTGADKYLSFYNQSYISGMDYNVYYSGGTWGNHDGTSIWATTLAGWKTFSSKDTNAIEADPNFINAAGGAAEDFKRSSYTENFTGSAYGVHAGAYETGSEVIGYVSPSTGTIKVFVSGQWKTTPVKVYVNGSWQAPIKKVYKNSTWVTY